MSRTPNITALWAWARPARARCGLPWGSGGCGVGDPSQGCRDHQGRVLGQRARHGRGRTEPAGGLPGPAPSPTRLVPAPRFPRGHVTGHRSEARPGRLQHIPGPPGGRCRPAPPLRACRGGSGCGWSARAGRSARRRQLAGRFRNHPARWAGGAAAGWLRNPIREGIRKDLGELAHVFAISCKPVAGLADKRGCHFLSPRSGESLAPESRTAQSCPKRSGSARRLVGWARAGAGEMGCRHRGFLSASPGNP